MLANYYILMLRHDQKYRDSKNIFRNGHDLKKMTAFPKDDCEGEYMVHAIDKAANHLGYNKIKELYSGK